MPIRRVAAFSVHTSPLAQPGRGDGGGMNVYIRSLLTALSRAGVECDVFTRCEGEGPTVVELEAGIRVVHIEAGPRSPVPKEQIPALLDEFSLRTREWMTSEHATYDVLHGHYWMSGVVAHRLKHELSLPLVMTFHTLDLVKSAAGLGAELIERAEAERSIIACSDLIIASTADERRDLVDGYGADEERIEIVVPGVDHRLFEPPRSRAAARTELGVDAAHMVLFAGRIQPLKGGELALRSFAAMGRDDAVLMMVGDPSGEQGASELARLRSLACELEVDAAVQFVGSVAHEELARYYRAADVCVVPSHSESFGLVALEAASCATPVVAAAVGGLRSIVRDGETGYLIEGRDPQAFAERMTAIIDDPQLARSLGARAASVSEQFSWNATAVRLRRAYGDLAAREPVLCR